MEDTGEIHVSISSSDHKPTDPRPFLVEIPAEEVDTTGAIQCGFQQHWIEASNDSINIDVSSGAGMASRWLLVSFTEKGADKRHVRIDISKVMEAVVDAATATDPGMPEAPAE